jgi:hypothetical protein
MISDFIHFKGSPNLLNFLAPWASSLSCGGKAVNLTCKNWDFEKKALLA